MKTFSQLSEQLLSEVLNVNQRLRRAAVMRRNKAKLKQGRRRARMKLATMKQLQRRAKSQARTAAFKRISKKSKSKLSYSMRASVERRLSSKAVKARIGMQAKRLLPTVRRTDRAKLTRK